jgi:hypothetical protein
MIDRTRSTIRLRAIGLNGLRDKAIGIYIWWSSSELGLNFGFYWQRGDLRVEQLPGRPAPKKGRLNIANRYIRSIEEAECALKMFAP